MNDTRTPGLRTLMVLSLLGLVMMAGCAAETTTDDAVDDSPLIVATAHLTPTQGNDVSGTVTFTLTEEGVRVAAILTGLTPGEHGFHIHENGDCSTPDGTSAGGHFNPKGTPHAGADDEVRHIGDLGNIVARAGGKGILERLDLHLAFEGDASIIGRAVIVHEKMDDFETQPTGGAGARVACGVIERGG